MKISIVLISLVGVTTSFTISSSSSSFLVAKKSFLLANSGSEESDEADALPDFEPTPVEIEFEPTPIEPEFEPTPIIQEKEQEQEQQEQQEQEVSTNTVQEPNMSPQVALVSLLRLASSSGRGEFATAVQKEQAAEYVDTLEQQNPTPNPTESPTILGKWELIYSSTQLFRSSPFFLAGRAVCDTQDQAKQYDWFCDMHRGALAISNIGAVRQIISETRMVSEFEVRAGAVPFLTDLTKVLAYSGGWPVTIDGSIVSSADITPVQDGKAWEIFMDTVEIKGSNIPGVRQALDQGLKLPSRGLAKVLEDNISTYSNPKPVFQTTYLSDTIRISRDQDGKIFVYTKVDDSTDPTDYSGTVSDLGITKLLEGFNDSILKFYL